MKTWHKVDKAEWPDGPWKDEPDRAQWIDGKSGLDCLITRSHMGNFCGYVGVPETHPLYNRDYEEASLSVHGGVTFSAPCDPAELEDEGICHTGTVANEKVWWFGFDCAHAYDLKPALLAMTNQGILPEIFKTPLYCGDRYCDFSYVVSEVEKLAEQLMATQAESH